MSNPTQSPDRVTELFNQIRSAYGINGAANHRELERHLRINANTLYKWERRGHLTANAIAKLANSLAPDDAINEFRKRIELFLQPDSSIINLFSHTASTRELLVEVKKLVIQLTPTERIEGAQFLLSLIIKDLNQPKERKTFRQLLMANYTSLQQHLGGEVMQDLINYDRDPTKAELFVISAIAQVPLDQISQERLNDEKQIANPTGEHCS